MFNLILFGPPGSGKGTQSDNVVARFNLVHLSTGNLLRQEIADKTALGVQAKTIMDRGQLVPDEVVIAMIETCLQANEGAKGFLFDGFPRTAAQAEALDKLLDLKKTSISKVVALDVSEEELVKRLLKRGETSGRSDDTNEAVIRKRYAVYKQDTEPVAEHYKALGRFTTIPGEGSVEEIFAHLSKVIIATMQEQEAAAMAEED